MSCYVTDGTLDVTHINTLTIILRISAAYKNIFGHLPSQLCCSFITRLILGLFFRQPLLPKELPNNSSLTGSIYGAQSGLPSLGLGLKQTTHRTTMLPKIPLATSTATATFPTSFPSIINQEKNKVKVRAAPNPNLL